MATFQYMMLMVIHPGHASVRDLAPIFFELPPSRGQTVQSWCEQYGYELQGDPDRLKKLFLEAAREARPVRKLEGTGHILSWRFV